VSRRLQWTLALLFVAVVIVLPLFVHSPYYTHLMILVMMNAVLAMTFVLVLRTGLINISVAGFWGIGAYSSAMLTLKAGMPFWASLPASLVIAGVVALIMGVVMLRAGSLGFIILSLLFGFIVPLVFGTFSVFGGHVGLIGLPTPEAIPLPGGHHIAFGSERSYYYLLFVFSVVLVVGFLALYRAWTGRAWRALGLSSDLAESVGISPFRYRMLAFVVASVAAALMGVFFAHYSANITPDTYGPFKAMYLQMYAVLGGIGFPIIGPLLGAAVFTLIPEVLRPTGEFSSIIVGAMVILILIFLPQGILGLLRGRRGRVLPEEVVAALGGLTASDASESEGELTLPQADSLLPERNDRP
jgi:branched-chain amino acid transport system permease protein